MAKINKIACKKIKLFIAKLKEEGINVESAYLFGSYSKGLENKWSDIDIAIISSDLTNSRFEERIRLTKIACNIDNRLEPVPFCANTFVDEDPLVWEIKNEGVPVNELL